MTDHTLSTPKDPDEQDARWEEFVSSQQGNDRLPFETHWSTFQRIFRNRREADGPPVVWRPDPRSSRQTNLFEAMTETGFSSYTDFHRWSATDKTEFWEYVLIRLGIRFEKEPQVILDESAGPKDPIWLSGASMNIADSCFAADADKVAIVCGGEDGALRTAVSYGELERLTNRFANGLHEHGIGPGNAIAVYMPMNLECVAAYLGIVKAGCRVVSIADSFSAEELASRMKIVSADTVLTVSTYHRSGKTIPMYEKVREAGIRGAIVIPNPNEPIPVLRDADITWSEFLSDRTDFQAESGDPYRITNILFSSGTTGEPKAISWTHISPLKGAMDGHFHQDIHGEDVVAWPTNIGWMMGPWLIYATFINRATMALYEGSPLERGFAEFIRDAQVSVLGVVPSIVRAWRNRGILDGIDWRSIRVLTSTGEPSNREDYLWLMRELDYKTPVIEYLGGTEIGGGHLAGTMLQPASPSTFTTPGLGIDFVVLNEDGRPVKEGKMGELFLIPPAIGLSQTLLNRNHHEVYYSGCPTGPDGELLRRHGDQTLRLHHGFYRAQGRADDTMNLGGIKVSSLELEHIAEIHDAVYESAAIAIQQGGEGAEQLVLVAVTNRSVDSSMLKQEIQRLISDRLNPLFKIHDLVVADSLPRTASNKLMRRTLRSNYMEKAQR